MNIRFCYLYRDSANYKQFNEVVFSNRDLIPLREINNRITNSLIDSTWFNADDWGLPNQFFDEYIWNNEIDHTWHEFEFVKESNLEPTQTISILDFLLKIETLKKS